MSLTVRVAEAPDTVPESAMMVTALTATLGCSTSVTVEMDPTRRPVVSVVQAVEPGAGATTDSVCVPLASLTFPEP